MYSQETHTAFFNEFIFSASRSGGAGGQNVNKVSSKVELKFNVQNSAMLSDEEKELVIAKLKNKINNEGFLIITSQESRSQLFNKQDTVRKFFALINSSLFKPKARKATKPSKSAKQKRLNSKKVQGEKKASRRFKNTED